MTRIRFPAVARPWLLWAGLVAGAHGAPTDIALEPLVTSSPSSVLPNLMFVMDDSGSMDWDYMPDWASDSVCRSTGATPAHSGDFRRACAGEPPFRSAEFNAIYYNPAITYRAPMKADGTSWPSQTSANTAGWTSVKNDAYGVQSTGSTNLVTASPDTEWCTDSTYVDCVRNGNYVLPQTIDGKSYATRRTTVASGTGWMAVGAPDMPTLQERAWGPHYYTIVPAEYCDAPNLRNCQATAAPGYPHPAPLRWCSSDTDARAATPAAGSCQAVKTGTFSHARFATKFFTPGTNGIPAVPAVPAWSEFTLSRSKDCTGQTQVAIGSVKVDGVELLKTATTGTGNSNDLAASLRDRINNGGSGYVASGTSNTVRITAPASAGDIRHGVQLSRTADSNCHFESQPSSPQFGGYVAPKPAVPPVPGRYPGAFTRTDIVPARTEYPKASTRMDCAGATCSYDEEMTNFANWWTYYRTRMQAMKTSASLAFAAVSNQFRIGWLSINNATGTDFLNPAIFDASAKITWFSKLTQAKPSGSTPLRSALSRVGRLYAGQLTGTSVNGSTATDPMQYSCQQNFTLLSTDGYWNESETPKRIDGATDVGDTDSALPRPMKDGNRQSNTLADVAAYYYDTDLRNPALGNCSGHGGADVCTDNVPTGGTDVAAHQHMTTFTLGLGASGHMQFSPDYERATRGDYFDVKNGSAPNAASGTCTWQTSGECTWPQVTTNQQTTIDDLWHAAVNGRGTYFSASNPAALYTGLSAALSAIQVRRGSAAAATTSNPNIATGDNFVFASTYTTGEWSGELVRQQLDLTTGAVTPTVDWSAQARLDANTARTLYTYDASNTGTRLKPFAWASLTSAEQAWFGLSHITAPGRQLSQFCSFGTTCLSDNDQAAAAGQPLVDFIRGDRTHEGALMDIGKYFRQRTRVLGDIVNSEVAYVKTPMFNYADTGYAAHRTAMASRAGRVYVGANDGMLHAFDAATGDEVWAYVPSMLLPRLYRLADKDYGKRHAYFVDASPAQADVYIGGQWRTLLVGGLGAGGRGYYALDVTDPNQPKALWEFTDDNLGLSFGKPEIAKLKDGTWVVLVPSGYNNITPGDGQGRLYVLNAQTGALIRTIATGAGSAATPSGLAHIRAWVDNTAIDNTVLRVYGGDLLGNVWRFDVNGDIGASGHDAQLLATLRGPTGDAQPVTARPELGTVGGQSIVFLGTGRYLGLSDLTDDRQQSIYAIKDALSATGWGNPRSDTRFIAQTLTQTTCPAGATVCSAGQTVRTGSNRAVDLRTDHGWYVDLPATSERATVDPQLALGTLAFTTNVLEASACTAGGSSYVNYFDYRTGAPVSTASGVTSVLLGNALATRPVLTRLPNQRVVGLIRLSDGSTVAPPVPVGAAAAATRRVSWRELTTQQ